MIREGYINCQMIHSESCSKIFLLVPKTEDLKLDSFYSFYFILANRVPALPGKLTKQYKGTHLDILHYTK